MEITPDLWRGTAKARVAETPPEQVHVINRRLRPPPSLSSELEMSPETNTAACVPTAPPQALSGPHAYTGCVATPNESACRIGISPERLTTLRVGFFAVLTILRWR